MVEHGTENAGVDSSSLSLGTIPKSLLNSVAKSPSYVPLIAPFADILPTLNYLALSHSFGESVSGFLLPPWQQMPIYVSGCDYAGVAQSLAHKK